MKKYLIPALLVLLAGYGITLLVLYFDTPDVDPRADYQDLHSAKHEVMSQRTMTGTQRALANHQGLITEQNLLVAGMQSKIAMREKITAEKRRKYAELQKKIAEENMRIAQSNKKRANEVAIAVRSAAQAGQHQDTAGQL